MTANLNELSREELIEVVLGLQEENKALKEDIKLQEISSHDSDDYRHVLEEQ